MNADVGGSFLQYLDNQRLIVDYAYVAAAALLIYDYLLTIHMEVKLVWLSPWNYSKTLFLLARYTPAISMYFSLHNQIFPDVSSDLCPVTYQVASWLFVAGILFAETMLLLRTWAVWCRDGRIGLCFAALLACCSILVIITNVKFLVTIKFAPLPYHGFRGCFVTDIDDSLLAQFIGLAVIDAIVLLFTVFSALRAYKSGNNGELTNIIHRDAILFYIYLLCLSISTAIVIHLLPYDFMGILCPLQSALYSIFSSRIIFNVRYAARPSSGCTILGLYSEDWEMSTNLTFAQVDEEV